MSNINIKNFVNIDIVPHISAQNVGTRDTVLLFTTEDPGTENILIKSLAQAKDYCAAVTGANPIPAKTNTLKYLTVYFNNGGVKVLVIPVTQFSEVGDKLEEIGNEYICVAYVSADTSVYSSLENLADTRAKDSTIYGVNQKLILARYDNPSTFEKANIKNFIVKYSTNVIGAEMAIAAYLSKINAYRSNTVYDYMFTIENLGKDGNDEPLYENLEDETYKEIIESDMNVDIMLAGEVRNCGGNCSNGDDVTNSFVRIVLQQTLTNSVLNILTQKLKNQSGLNKIYSTMSEELEKYKSCGYLTTDKIWNDQDLYIEYNGKNYLIIERGTPIQNGYFIKILPFSTLSDDDKQKRNTPPIYVIIAEQYGIRKITINGEAI